MFAATDFLSTLGFGSQVVVAASLVVVAFYVYRAVSIGSIVVSVLSLMATHALVLLVAFAVVIALGWVAPNAGTMLEHVRLVWDFASGRGVSFARSLVEGVGLLG
ncbi:MULTISPECIES: hypothetical protein [Halorubrum]|uniref:Uncharacterized protein n=1 Tax=Halorubrum hochstenium ATCC 700873 TaxID=1227481 RepID=M0FBZ4_9EURY|nr:MULTISPECIES: hypothetical protein [Halorubrum]ELZ56757.1 hypothetical protein C467_07787 [Halorubrum hochstenium ATCC 700873]